jgi:hypothetical protein
MSVSPPIDADFERRWAAWQERGREHNRRVAARMRIALPTLALILLAGSYFLFR